MLLQLFFIRLHLLLALLNILFYRTGNYGLFPPGTLREAIALLRLSRDTHSWRWSLGAPLGYLGGPKQEA